MKAETETRKDTTRTVLADECPRCHGYSEVLRVVRPRVALKRRRRCLSCGHRWNTMEIMGE
jgi:transcriptional regulator NrdR family protein